MLTIAGGILIAVAILVLLPDLIRIGLCVLWYGFIIAVFGIAFTSIPSLFGA